MRVPDSDNSMHPNQLRLMAVHAHPDDESSKGAAVTAKYVNEGIDVMVVTCTGGERGDVLNAAAQDLVDQYGLNEVRRREMAQAASILGVKHEWLGFEDSGFTEDEPLPDGCFAATPLEVSVPPLVKLIREFRPQVVTTYDENGGYPHPDHIQTHLVTMAAVEQAADSSLYPEYGEAFSVQKVYYNQQFHKERVVALHQTLLDEGLESPYEEWLMNWEDKPNEAERVTTKVPAADFFHVRDAALKAHATQIEPDGRWFAVPLDLQRRAWPTEDFQLAVSLVNTDPDENDLFAGLREANNG
jgi:mycothiol S-conjugate amidase